MPGLSIKPNLAHDITFSVVTPDDVATLKAQRVAGLFLTDSSAIVDTPSANMENPSATIELQGDSSFAAKINRYHGCRQVLRPSPWVLRAPSHRPSRNSPRASIFELASMLNEARARKGWRFAIEQAQGH